MAGSRRLGPPRTAGPRSRARLGAGGVGGQRTSFRDGELQRHQVDAVHALGDRVLDLKPGVELQEVELLVPA